MKPWLDVFLRVNNRKRTHRPADFLKAGYPMVVYTGGSWNELHKLCQEIFVDGKGRSTYIWFGNRFFFVTEEDAQAFRALWYIL